MSGRVLITGIGAFTSIGLNVKENLKSLRERRSGIGYSRFIDTAYKNEIPVCEIPWSNETLLQMCGMEGQKGLTRTAMIGILAAREAYRSAGQNTTSTTRTGLVSSTTVGGMCVTENTFFDRLDLRKNGDFIDFIDSHDCGESTERIADDLGIKDYISTISTACSSAANAMMSGARLIKNGMLDRVLCGGTDALSRFTINGFNTLMILDREHCRPYDDTRVGLNLGEGAGYLMLESEESALRNGSTILAELSGYSNTNDAYHQTASSPEGNGAFMAMSQALAMSGLKAEDIHYINVHGTATPNNDLSEGRAMERLFDGKVPRFSSTKPFTGHTLAACGAIEAVYSILAIQNNIIFPSLNFNTRIAELNISPEKELLENVQVDHVLSNSFGFGGNNTSIIISRA